MGGGGARISDFCFYKESESKKKNLFGVGVVVAEGGLVEVGWGGGTE